MANHLQSLDSRSSSGNRIGTHGDHRSHRRLHGDGGGRRGWRTRELSLLGRIPTLTKRRHVRGDGAHLDHRVRHPIHR